MPRPNRWASALAFVGAGECAAGEHVSGHRGRRCLGPGDGSAEIAGPRNAHLLDTPIGAALLRVNRLAFVADAPHHHLSVQLSPNRSRVLLSQTADELETGDGLTIAHDVATPR